MSLFGSTTTPASTNPNPFAPANPSPLGRSASFSSFSSGGGTQPGTGSSFLSSTTLGQGTSTGSLFSSATPTTTTAAGAVPSFSFAPTTSTATPATTTAAAIPNFSFGSSASIATPALGSTLGASTPVGAASTNPASQAPPSLLSSVRSQVPIESQILALKNAWDPSSPSNSFHGWFYNLLPSPEHAKLYTSKPALATEAEWNRARRANPDEKKFAPALAVGWDDLKKRALVQDGMAKAHLGKVEELSTLLQKLSKHHTLELSPKLLKLQTQSQALTIRLLHLISRLSPLLPLPTSSTPSPAKAVPTNLLHDLEEMQRTLAEDQKRIGTLWAAVGRWRGEVEGGGYASDGSGREGWVVGDEEALSRVLRVLEEQQKGLDHLIKILKRDEKDVGVVREAFGLQLPGPSSTSGNP
ncbi:hypothetical protein BT69DRAFT_1316634 [Atractiella rhizophila]|nr:hypothetical protein BT69DRAFT_1316634 [Atractiella rhizophila]